MTTNLEIFDYKILIHKDNTPKEVSWQFLKLENTMDAFNKEYSNWDFNYNRVNNGYEVTIMSDINVPWSLVNNSLVRHGTFYQYSGLTKFFVDKENITAEIIGELTLVHFSRFYTFIALDTCNKSNTTYVHSTKIYCIAKLIVTASTKM